MDFKGRVGYACINMTLSATGVMTNRKMIQRTWLKEGVKRASQLSKQNCLDLLKILEWNNQNGLGFFRISSNLFPWMTEYKFEELPDWEEIQEILAEAGRIARQGSQRLEFHPTHFTILASNNPATVERSIRDLEQHSKIFDTMGFEPSHWNPLNIHVGGAFGDKTAATQRWAANFKRLSNNCRSRVVVENDDKSNMYSVKDLHELIYQEVEVPITFDIFHHGFCTGGLPEDQAAQMASSTWKDAPMVIHWSSSMKIHENSQVKDVAHADYIYDPFQDWGTGGYLMCESKAKELSVLEYWKKGPRS